MDNRFRVGTAGWTIPRLVAEDFPSEGSGLQRYAARLNCAEINSSFYRPHKPQTYERWRDATPPDFAFAVKAPKAVTHEARLVHTGDVLDRFTSEIAALGPKLGPVLFQLPPSLAFDAEVAAAFFEDWRGRHAGLTVCEPRHVTWFDDQADALLKAFEISRVAADPARAPNGATPGGYLGLTYVRLHGSPRMYATPYGPDRLEPLAVDILAKPAPAWIVFDNTLSGAAARDALWMNARLDRTPDLQGSSERLAKVS